MRKRLLAKLEFELEANDFAEAVQHQERLQQAFERLLELYPDGRFSLTERRKRTLRPVEDSALAFASGRMHEYND
jgi:hypothetical protein